VIRGCDRQWLRLRPRSHAGRAQPGNRWTGRRRNCCPVCASIYSPAGRVPFDTARLSWLGEQVWSPVGASRYEVISLSRSLFEQVVLRRVLDLEGVRLRDAYRVSGLHRKGPPESQGWRVETAEGDGVDADVVIDASGRGSRLPAWLAALAGSPPKVSEVDARIARSRRRRLYRPVHALRRRGGVPRAANRRYQATVGQWRP